MFCPNCGKSNLQQAKFCKYCGASLSCYDEQNNKDNTADLPPQPRIYQDNINLPPQHRQPDNRAGFGYDHNPHDGYYTDIVTEKSKSSNAAIIVSISLAALVLIVFAVVALVYFSGNKNGNSAPQNDSAAVIAPTTTTMNPVDDEKTVEVPNVTGFPYYDAVKKLGESNLQTRVSADYSSTVPDNCIISQSPSQGTQAKEGDVVAVVMSKGKYAYPNYDYFGIPSNARNDNSYIIPQSSSRYLTADDTKSLGAKALELARNEIYAKHGRRFDSTELQSFFNSKSWYIGTVEPSSFNESELNEYETANVDFLNKQEQERKNKSSSSSSKTSSAILYRVRKSWNDEASQKGAYYNLSKAKECADLNSGYSVFDENGRVVYSPESTSKTESVKPIFHSITSSSNLVSSNGTVYSPENICYDDTNCWAEGKSDSGEGEWIMFSDDKEQRVSEIGIVNGFAKSAKLYNENGKIKRVRFEFSDGSSYSAYLTARSNATDSNYYTVDTVRLPHTVSTKYVKIIIDEALEGTKYNDTCITLVTFG